MPNPELVRIARTPRPTTIPGVVERLLAIEATLPEVHGIVAFTRLYRWTTENVHRAVEAGRFEAPADMVALDVHFADLYFDAIDAWALGTPIPPAWAPLLAQGGNPDISPLRFAVAGMHAHINRDLAVALAGLDGGAPADDSPRFRDYVLVDRLLDETSDTIRHALLPPVLHAVDVRLGELDDRVIIGAIGMARRAAWEVGQVLSTLRPRPLAWELALRCLDTAVGASASVLLIEPHRATEDTRYTPVLREALDAR